MNVTEREKVPDTGWKMGVEVELMAPRGLSRRHLAVRLAADTGGTVQTYFLHQEEPSKVPGMTLFDNLTQAFEVVRPDGRWAARLADDLTLQVDLDRRAPPKPGWFRIVSDDRRLLRLIARHGPADQDAFAALSPTADLFGTRPRRQEGAMVQIVDETGAPVAIGAPLPGERERPCEVISAPMIHNQLTCLESLLAPARELGFSIPIEAAVHLHFDATPLKNSRVFANLVRFFSSALPILKDLVMTNPRCRRLGPWPDALIEMVDEPGFRQLPWPAAQQRLQTLNLTKYCDLNLKNVVHEVNGKDTVEVRILPGMIHGQEVMHCAHLFAGLLRYAIATDVIDDERGEGVERIISELEMPDQVKQGWV
ncbi:MAG: amidoligase family protein [Myxococcota bacterium]